MKIINSIKSRIDKALDIFLMLLARLVACFIEGKNKWLVEEKPEEARDNGYWFYRYLREKHSDLNVYYVISSDSPDISKILALGNNIIKPHSFKHRCMFWAVDYLVGSQPIGDYFSSFKPLRCLARKKQTRAFIRHGIVKDATSHGLDARITGINIITATAVEERNMNVIRLGYSENQAVLTGLCRYDNLPIDGLHRKSRTILIMPTFRHWIMTSSKDRIPTAEEVSKFEKDQFFTSYSSLMKSERLHSMLERYGYKVVFYPHYCFQPFIGSFLQSVSSDNVIIASSEDYDVQRLLIDSDVLITDFSSIFFDFAYMKKPEIFYQFDEEHYRAGHYQEGYFKYRRDAFGPVYTKEDEVLDYLEVLLKNNTEMEPQYEERVDTFFAFRDHNNCERVYNAITNYKK